MKHVKKIMAIVIAMVMTLGLSSMSAFAEEGGGSITITPPTGVDAKTENTYKIYKVFDATGDGKGGSISYKLVSGKTKAPKGFDVDSAGNVSLIRTTGDTTQLTEDEIKAIAAYVTEDDLVGEATSTGGAAAVVGELPNGYYYITTTTGSVVTITSTNPSAKVADKNTVPTVDKEITGASSMSDAGKKALAQIGTVVEYTATVTVGNGSKNLVFHDKMGEGLELQKNTVTVKGTNNYSILETPYEGDTLTIEFDDGIAADTEITITYEAKITADALTALKNDAYLNYGDDNETTHSQAEVYNAQISVVKYDGAVADKKPLAGAGFKLKLKFGDGEEAYYKYYKLVNGAVTWVDDEAEGDEHISDSEGKVPAFNGLADGTYTLVETTVPAGYNKAEDKEITITPGNYAEKDLKLSVDVENKKGSVLPGTGGMGTTIFYAIGGILVLGAGIMLIARRRVDSEK